MGTYVKLIPDFILNSIAMKHFSSTSLHSPKSDKTSIKKVLKI
jgi:hypothetical protein